MKTFVGLSALVLVLLAGCAIHRDEDHGGRPREPYSGPFGPAPAPGGPYSGPAYPGTYPQTYPGVTYPGTTYPAQTYPAPAYPGGPYSASPVDPYGGRAYGTAGASREVIVQTPTGPIVVPREIAGEIARQHGGDQRDVYELGEFHGQRHSIDSR